MPGRWWAALLLGLAVVSSCNTTPPVSTGFTVEYRTGSIPPPFNYSYTLSGDFAGDQPRELHVRYDLTYHFRDGMTGDELQAQGYGPDDDLHWQGILTGSEVGAWEGLTIDTRMGPIPIPLPGADSFEVTIRYAGGGEVVGLAEQRSEWEALIDAIDQQARAETGHPRPDR